jgi:hypothetical protein
VDDLRGLARVLKTSARIARHNARQEELKSRLDERTACMVGAEPLAMPIAQAVARRVRASLGGTLQDLATKSGVGASTDSGRDSPKRGKGARGSKRRKGR